MPFAALAGSAESSFGKSPAQALGHGRVEHHDFAGNGAGSKQSANGCKGLCIARLDAVVAAMAARFGKQRAADVVRSVDKADLFSPVQPVDDSAVIAHEGFRVPLAEIGQHAQEMMRADRNGHDALMAAIARQPKTGLSIDGVPGDGDLAEFGG